MVIKKSITNESIFRFNNNNDNTYNNNYNYHNNCSSSHSPGDARGWHVTVEIRPVFLTFCVKKIGSPLAQCISLPWLNFRYRSVPKKYAKVVDKQKLSSVPLSKLLLSSKYFFATVKINTTAAVFKRFVLKWPADYNTAAMVFKLFYFSVHTY